jgi:hypothetical protein
VPAGSAAAARSATASSAATKPGTLFVAVFAGSLPGSVIFSTPPYKQQDVTEPLIGPSKVGVTKSGSLIVASVTLSSPAPLSIIEPPYTGAPVTITKYFWAGGMVMDPSENVYRAEGIAPRSDFNYLTKYLAPDYKRSIRFGGERGRYIGAMAALPGGALAVASVRNGAHDTTEPGTVEIYPSPLQRPTVIHSLQYVSSMTLVPEGLIVLECPKCYGLKKANTFLALLAPPYTSVTKVLAKLPGVTASSVVAGLNGDIFVKEDTMIDHFAPPYAKGVPLPNTVGAMESMIVTPNGDLFYGSTEGDGPHGQFAVDKLAAPYTGRSETAFTSFGPIGGMAVSP